jgi:hypothetical protein
MTRGKAYRGELLQHGLLAGLCTLAACIPNAGSQAPVAQTGFCVKPPETCTPDPMPPKTVDCTAAEAGLEFAPTELTIADFDSPTNPNVGEFMYSYTDATAQIYTNLDDGTQVPVGYAPSARTANVCTTDTNNHVLHVTGGHEQPGSGDAGRIVTGAPFLGWGGGLGVSLVHLTTDRQLCFGSDGKPKPESARSSYCQPDSAGTSAYKIALNLSDWDGVAVWARRGPDSQPLLRVLVGNKYVDEDISFLMYRDEPYRTRYCERVLECACTNGKPCLQWDTVPSGMQSGLYCGDPATDPQPKAISSLGVTATNSCGRTRCNDDYPAFGVQDAAFVHRPCTPYAFRSGGQSSYCWDPDPNHPYPPSGLPDSPPAESDQQCGDYWTFPLELTTEWQLFLVPFTTMYQQGWAKRWPFFDISSVSVVRLTWDAGWVDYWIDNFRFYRVRR